MTRDACSEFRTALLAGGDAGPHGGTCAACAGFERGLRLTDGALTRAADDASRARLSPAASARISAAAAPGIRSRGPLRGRVLDGALRAAAVAAVLVAAVQVAPANLLADDDLFASAVPRLPVEASLPIRLPSMADLGSVPAPEPVDVPAGTLPLAAAAGVVFAAAALLAARRRGA